MTLFRRKYRVQSTRLPGWDYRTAGQYFVTICTRGREPFLAEVVNGRIVLSSIGKIAAAEWEQIAIRRRDVDLDEWIVMPNHLHAILTLKGGAFVETPHRQRDEIGPSNGVSRQHGDTRQRMHRGVSTTSRLTSGYLGAIIGQFKARSTKRIWREGFREFGWQPRFYDHIIRDEGSLPDIRQYIIDNPHKWELDKDNLENLYM
jgi:putative transposase